MIKRIYFLTILKVVFVNNLERKFASFYKAVKNKKKTVNSEELILKTARHTIEIETETLNRLKECIGLEFVHCVREISACSGRLIITGVGKSALVAKKVVATLNSTGTHAIFMHAADAIHGDLGMIKSDDYAICISKSGETAEIKVLVPLLKNLSIPIIAMVSRPDSFLGRNALYVLHTPVSREADPNNLAPTASTTAQMAMGDALATALLALKGFTPADFAQFHPGGALGKQLYLKVSDIYINNQKPVVYEADDLQKTILEMTSKCLGATAVLNHQQELTGIITDGDLRRMLEKGLDINKLQAVNIMGKNPKTINKDQLAIKAFRQMQRFSITQLIVVGNDQEYLGIIHLHDLIKEGFI